MSHRRAPGLDPTHTCRSFYSPSPFCQPRQSCSELRVAVTCPALVTPTVKPREGQSDTDTGEAPPTRIPLGSSPTLHTMFYSLLSPVTTNSVA